MVQYKAMELQDQKDKYIYRLPNQDLDKEIQRMRELESELKKIDSKANDPANFRLHSGPFFLKFCPRKMKDQLVDSELIPGMYFHLDHWQELQKANTFGEGGQGQRLEFTGSKPKANVDRYFNNTEFAALVGNAWIGTSINQSEKLEKMIQSILATGKSVTFAQASEINPS
jgi:hypothetical protein